MSTIIASQAVIAGAPVLLAPARPGRLSVKLRILLTGSSPLTIFIGQDDTVSPSNGYPVVQSTIVGEDGSISLPVDGEVWGTRTPVSPLSIAVLEVMP